VRETHDADAAPPGSRTVVQLDHRRTRGRQAAPQVAARRSNARSEAAGGRQCVWRGA